MSVSPLLARAIHGNACVLSSSDGSHHKESPTLEVTMRLLDTQTLKLEESDQDVPEYAILSHRWSKGEVTFQDIANDRGLTKAGWPKIVSRCRMAASRNISYVWIDTCCIDKSSSAELTESIDTMYAWYEQDTECYAILSDVHGSLEDCDSDDFVN